MNRFFLLALAVLAVLSLPAVSQADILVGIDKDLGDQWDSVGEAFEQEFNTSVWFQGYAQNSMAQQIVLQSFAKSGKLHFVMVPHSWGSTLSRYLVDLSDLERSLLDRGAEVVYVNRQPLGVEIPFAPDWFLGVLSWPDDFEIALEFLAFVAQGGATGIGTSALSPQAAIAAFSTEKINKADHNPLFDGALEALMGATQATVNSMASQMTTAIPTFARTALESLATLYGVPFSAANSTITVVLESQPGRSASNVAALGRLGVNQNAIQATSKLIKITIPISDLSALAKQLTGVAFIRAPYTPYALGTPSEGTAAIGADAFHAAGIRGNGSKVAIIDLGFSGLSQAQSRGDLPYTVVQNDLTGTGLTTGITHGTAVAEIVYDIAPDAELYLIKIADEVDLDLAVTYCLTNGIDIINHSLGWYNTNNYDGTGTIADIAQRAITGGILWVNAAGNSAQNHWEGTFADGNSDGWLDQNVTFYATAGSPIVLFLTWNEWPQSSTDYDLYLFNPSSTLIASSTKHQTGTEEPTESIQTTATVTGLYTVRIQGVGTRSLELFNLYQTVSPLIAASSILAPANAANVIAVGAVDHSQYTTGPIQPYSSQGPSNDGRTKPDLVAPDNVATGTSPYAPFPGTSGAAPHVAGAAALLLSQTPGLSEYALRTELLSQTIAMGSANVFGNGRLSLQAPAGVNAPPNAAFTVSPSSGQPGTWFTFSASGSSDPDGSIIGYAWNFGDGTTGSGVTAYNNYAVAGVYTVQLTVTDNNGATDMYSLPVVVTSSANQLPHAAFTVSPSSGQPGTWFTFNASSSSDPDGTIASYFWNFGDGNTDSGVTAYNNYAVAGVYTVQLTVTDNNGGIGTTTRSVSVQAASAPDLVIQSITYTPGSPVLGQSVTFSITVVNQGNATAGLFRVRLAGTSSSTQSTITQLTAGSSRVISLVLPLTSNSETFTATADDLNQITESSETNNTKSVLVSAAAVPLVAEAGGPYSGVAGSSIAFSGASSTGAITTYAWSFGDGGSAQGVSTSHTYANPGTYTATLIVYSGGQQSVDTAQVIVSAPQAALATQVSLPQSVYGVDDVLQITYSVNRSAYVYLCDVTSDGRVTLLFPNWLEPSAYVSSGAHTFPGTSGYTLRISEPLGTETLYLFAASGPIANFPTSLPSGYFSVLSTNPTSFQNSVLSTMQSQFSSDDWAFDSRSFQVVAPTPTTGTLRVISSPTNALVRIDGMIVGNTTHEQPNLTVGNHSVEVSKSGYQAETRQVMVVAGQTTTVSVTLTSIPNVPPISNFGYSPTAPFAGDTVVFNAGSATDSDGTITTYSWNFGDGNSGSGLVASHVFAVGGTYTVTLTVTDDDGAQHTVGTSLVVGARGAIRVVSTPTDALVRIDGVSVGNTTHEQSNVAPGLHTVQVSKTGYQTETRQVTVTAGLTSTVSVTLTPIPNVPPASNFGYSPTTPTAGDTVTFNASSATDSDGSITAYAWNFGDGDTGNGLVAAHVFAVGGTYTVSLTVTDDDGAQNTVGTSVVVNAGAVGDEGWFSPVSFEDPAANWVVEERAFDDDIDANYNTNAQYYGHAAGEWSSYLILDAPAGGIQSDRIRVLVGDSFPISNVLSWDIDVYRDGAWVDVYMGSQGSLSEHRPDDAEYSWVELAFDQGLVTRMRLRSYNNAGGGTLSRVYEADFHDATVPTP